MQQKPKVITIKLNQIFSNTKIVTVKREGQADMAYVSVDVA